MSLKINSLYLFANIFEYIPLIKKLNIVKYSKKYQILMNLTILNYQICFIYCMLKKEKKNKFIKEIGDKIYDKEIEEKDKKDSSIYNILKEKLNKENSFILLDNNFDENYKNLKQGDSIKIVIGRCSDKNIIEERIKLLNQKNIIYKEIEYLFDDKDNEHQDRDQFEKNKKLDKDFIDKLIMNNNRDSHLYITGQTISSLSIKKNSIPSVFFSS